MQNTLLKLNINENLYVKNPQDTELGQKILLESVHLINELGFEHFTFKKLALHIDSTEASIYRYFENKNKLLIYLMNWYWVWMDYKIQYLTHHIKSPKEKLNTTVTILCQKSEMPFKSYIAEEALFKIVVSESSKSYLIKEVDSVNKEGAYIGYKSLNKKIAANIVEINPEYPYPNTLVSTIVETIHQQLFFAQHLPSLTNIHSEKGKEKKKSIENYIHHLIETLLQKKYSKQ